MIASYKSWLQSRQMRRHLIQFVVLSFGCQFGMAPQAFSQSAPTSISTKTAIEPLSSDDVSWLFPVPRTKSDLANLIAVGDLKSSDEQNATRDIWPSEVFAQFIAIAESQVGAVASASSRIKLPTDAHKIDAWFVSGLRIDAGAPGLSPDIIAQYGQAPQIRLIIQPVTQNADGTVTIHDIAGHLIFDFTAAPKDNPVRGCLPLFQPDNETFHKIVSDFADLRSKLETGTFGGKKIVTANKPLGVHPGFADTDAAPALRKGLVDILESYLAASRLGAMAIMALPEQAPEPWMFLSMVGVPKGFPLKPEGGFLPVHSPMLDGSQFTEALKFAGNTLEVLPEPHTNNLNPITCKNEATFPPTLPEDARKGMATAELFKSPTPTPAKIAEITDLIADPARSHFFNTDCVSCHTETRRAMDMLKTKSFKGLDPAVMPQEKWNVRNFGWFPSFFRSGTVEATATRRTANETAAVVSFINTHVLTK